MYKEFIICTVVILIVVIANFTTQNYTKQSIEFINEKLESFKENIIKEEKKQEKNEEEINDIMEEWKKQYGKLAYYIEHDELEKVETELTALRSNIQVEKYEEAVIDIDKSTFILNHIKEKSKFDIKNIF